MSITENIRGPYLVWKDLTVLVPNPNTARKVLNEICGFAQPNRIMALMGPSGSGKSTLLDALAGQLSANVKMTGQVLYKGKMGGSSRDGVGISYLNQEDIFLGALTVRETITYSANLRLSKKMDKNEINEQVERTIMEMGLEHCANNKIGNWHLRGISDGEKKRLSIALEILTHPYVMFLDEPTSGLDSASAYFVILALRNIALHGRIVVCSIHQPSYYLFDLFDDLYLLSGGQVVYFGEANMAVKFFAESGFPCPARRNPSDHFLRCINSDFDNVASTLLRSKTITGITTMPDSVMNLSTQEIKEILIEKYKISEYSTNARDKIQDLILLEENIRLSNKSKARSSKQLSTLIHRSLLNMSRDMGYYWLRILFYVAVAISVGSMYFKIDTSFLAITARAKCEAFIYGFMICLSIGGLPSFIEELKVYNREMLNKHYGEGLLSISNFISSLPFLVVIAVSSGTVVYSMVKLHSGFSHFCYFCINFFCCISVIECSMMVVAALVPNVLMGIGIGTALIVFMMMSSEIFRPLPDLPKFFWRYPMSYISFASWALQGVYKNDMLGLEFDNLEPEDSKLKGETVLLTTFGIPLDHSKWWDLAALMCLLIFHRLLLFVVLKYKHRVSLVFCNLSAKRIFKLRGLPMRASSSRSSRDRTTLPTMRNKNFHPLSSLEDLTSPPP
ncbi:ABC transporter G family member 15-like [Ziziphus jujuba]|uniref:ABC transporter G family member 15-like n=1 Tax=Ziziphus jujuba TaxID=326968 RepID=A0A6P4BG26_ZIZJJ|nr:ABC transporter G family member 15-like [Ziziphus jujuba]